MSNQTESAWARWNAYVGDLKRRGIPIEEALARAREQQPELYEAMLQERGKQDAE